MSEPRDTAADTETAPGGPLRGKVVLDLTTALAGPYATFLLGALGATVIKIENPATGGDSSRNNSPYVGSDGVRVERSRPEDMSVSLLGRCRYKKSITLNLKNPDARQVFFDLLPHADIVVENYAAGTADRLGIGYAAAREVNPRLVYASISGFGAQGTAGSGKAMDSIIQALSGVMYVTGEPDGEPVRCGLPIGDLLAPMFAVIGVLAAVVEADRSGIGQHIDVSMLGALTSLMSIEPFGVYEQMGIPARTGRTVPRLAPFGIFPATDGWVALCAPTDTFARGVFAAMDRGDLAGDERFGSRDQRVGHSTELNDVIEKWTRQRTKTEIVDRLAEYGVPAAPVRAAAEAIEDEMVRDRGEVIDLVHPRFGSSGVAGPGLPIRFSATPDRADHPAPMLGEHNAEVLTGLLGYGEDRLAALRAGGAL